MYIFTAAGICCIPQQMLRYTDAVRIHFCFNCVLLKNPESGTSIKNPHFAQ